LSSYFFGFIVFIQTGMFKFALLVNCTVVRESVVLACAAMMIGLFIFMLSPLV